MVGELLRRRMPYLRRLNQVAAVPVDAAKVENRQVVAGIERERLAIGFDRLRRRSRVFVSHPHLEPAHRVGLERVRLLQKDRQAFLKPVEKVERSAKTVAVMAASELERPAEAALGFRPIALVLCPMP